MEDYCNYQNPEWRKRFSGLKNGYYKTEIEGNTFYIVHDVPECYPTYKKVFKNFYRKVEKERVGSQTVMCVLVMCKLKESTLIDVLQSFGFDV